MIYLIESPKGYWLANGQGYTRNAAEAGRFTFEDLQAHNLDGCTLRRDRDAEQRTSPEDQ